MIQNDKSHNHREKLRCKVCSPVVYALYYPKQSQVRTMFSWESEN